MKKTILMSLIVIVFIFLWGTGAQAKGQASLTECMKEYNADDYIAVDSREEMVKYLYDCFLDYKGACVIYRGEDYKYFTMEDAERCIYDVMKIDKRENLNDCESLWGNIKSYKKGIAVMDDYTIICISLNYKHTRAEMEQVNKYIRNTLMELNQKYHFADMNIAGKSKVIHDYIVKNFDYDDSHSVYTEYEGIFGEKHIMVCQGYSLLYYKMLNYIGVNCKIIVSETHAWNLVQLESGKWYHVDVTNDDMGIYGTDKIYYTYFLKEKLDGKMYQYLDNYIFYDNLNKFNLANEHISYLNYLKIMTGKYTSDVLRFIAIFLSAIMKI